MALDMDMQDQTDELLEADIKFVEELVNFAANMEKVGDESELSITFVSNEEIREINRDYRGKDEPTDVISFAMEELGEGEVEIAGAEIPRILGDIIISIPRAREQAEEYGHSFRRELGFLAVHGLLHLLGYDHMNEADEKIMFGRQKAILNEYGLTR